MKTTILTIATVFTLVFGISRTTYAATRNEEEVSTILPDMQDISQVEVHGNVELYLSDGTTDQVKVYDNYYAQNALVQNENGVLRISNYSNQKLVVWLTAKDIRDVYAFDEASVKSFGELSFIDLNVKLFDHASAKLNLDTFTASIELNNHSKADVDGSTTEAQLKYNASSCLNKSTLVAQHITEEKTFEQHFHRHQSEFASL